ncbi:hypothetical protein MASR2M44_07830 [Bacteroidota bacterium]
MQNELHKLNQVLNYVKQAFVARDEAIDLLGIALVAQENAFLMGPPGTAKSAIVRRLSDCIENGKNFEYLLTRFTEPNELFGPFDIRKLREGELLTNTEGMLPEASMVFLDELFNANSAILNSLLLALNERIFRRGKETRKLPTLLFVGASNQLPDDESLAALLDRFLIRMRLDYVEPDLLEQVLIAGWNAASDNETNRPRIQPSEIIRLQAACKEIDLSGIRNLYIDLIRQLRNAGVKVSDRRAVKIQNLLAASALISGRTHAIPSDCWVMKYIWDTEEQVELLRGMIDPVIESDTSTQAHPQSGLNQKPEPENLMQDLLELETQLRKDSSPANRTRIKDKLRYFQSRIDWIESEASKVQLNQKAEALWTELLRD